VVAVRRRIDMPTLDRLAKNGLTYTQWHTTAGLLADALVLSDRPQPSPERLRLDLGVGGRLPGYSGHIPKECATMARVLRDAGWSTFWVGKNHNVPGRCVRHRRLESAIGRSGSATTASTASSAARRTSGSRADRGQPLRRPALRPEDGYHLSKDIADKAISFIRDSKQTRPEKPWYLWYCPARTTRRITRRRTTSTSTRASSTTATRSTANGC
jgi:arylsulfatase